MNTENKYQFKGTGGNWTISTKAYDAIISDIECPESSSEYYGGALICESVKKTDRHLIAAAPELLQACIEMMKVCDEVKDITFVPVYKIMQTAVEKALNIK